MKNTDYLLQALDLAAKRRGFCAPNPAVGAVIVKNNQVIATGYHYGPGHDHAEVDALNKIGNEAFGATLYVTLEPCCVWGRTPPCTDLLIKRGIKQVIYGFTDPNPAVAGAGINQLQQAGIHCLHEPNQVISDFYQAYQRWWQHSMPRVTAKLALSLDGKIADIDGKPFAITGQKAAEFTHQQRANSDAILTTARTIICDDPKLNVRQSNHTLAKPLYILDTKLQTPVNAKIWQTAQNITLFHANSIAVELVQSLQQLGARCIAVPFTAEGLCWHTVLTTIAKDGKHDLWVEAGGRCFESLILSSYCQRAYIYVAAKILGPQAVTGLRQQALLQKASQIEWQACDLDAICKLDFGKP